MLWHCMQRCLPLCQCVKFESGVFRSLLPLRTCCRCSISGYSLFGAFRELASGVGVGRGAPTTTSSCEQVGQNMRLLAASDMCKLGCMSQDHLQLFGECMWTNSSVADRTNTPGAAHCRASGRQAPVDEKVAAINFLNAKCSVATMTKSTCETCIFIDEECFVEATGARRLAGT